MLSGKKKKMLILNVLDRMERTELELTKAKCFELEKFAV